MSVDDILPWVSTIIGGICGAVAIYVTMRVEMSVLNARLLQLKAEHDIRFEFLKNETIRAQETSDDAHERLDKLMRSNSRTIN